MTRRTFLQFSTIALASNLNAQSSDIFVSSSDFLTIKSIALKLNAVKRHVGYGNFNIISFDDMLKTMKCLKKEFAFTKKEMDIINIFFYDDFKVYGFYGKRTCKEITETISKKDVIKIPQTGHYLYKGEPKDDYEKIIKDVGDSIILTSGVRSIVKQMSLFFAKVVECEGNISKAVHSIAPPSYSYHSIGDFDVGKKGWGYKNFTASFARTKEFWKLTKLPYISMRYTINNLDGVRFEPWHIKIS